jgi:hypothetical protein
MTTTHGQSNALPATSIASHCIVKKFLASYSYSYTSNCKMKGVAIGLIGLGISLHEKSLGIWGEEQ